jgi:hypothetical protein
MYGVTQMLMAFFITSMVSFFNPNNMVVLSVTFVVLGGVILASNFLSGDKGTFKI